MAVHPATDTIASIATAPGVAGIGIIRISGSESLSLLKTCFVPRVPRDQFVSHKLYYGTIVNQQGQALDEALAVYMQAPHTYTREDVVELHCHGSYVVLQSVLQTLLVQGCRPAEPGEFTKRAFLAGRIDLTRAEAIIDLLQAQTEGAARLAVNQLQGQLYTRLEHIRQQLIGFLALLEVAIDFPDDDVEIFDTTEVSFQLREQVISSLEELLAWSEQGKVVREGIKVVLAGLPNAGKSSLLNALLQEERALVAPVPGTTRDTIEERIVVRGIPIHLVDTAGIRKYEDPIEALGVERARQKLEVADLVLFVVDGSVGMTQRDRDLYQSVCHKSHLVVINKSDLMTTRQLEDLFSSFPEALCIPISAKHGHGIDRLLEALFQTIVGGRGPRADQMTCAPNTRHRAVLLHTLEACQRFEQALIAGAPVDLVAVEIQSALDCLGDIIGLTTPDEVLDTVFSRFCIGK
ncbi:MAG: tRNA uridine-5-carboxymethylaminomethyl(34) synthesis GTPase MnmE [Desulfobulbus oligotrophicus]|nr:tRNA uridine-5-carboxymethylaminomethyl(34) synthesis GTPase MnmE [Desulfobulbus oligotrophicus]